MRAVAPNIVQPWAPWVFLEDPVVGKFASALERRGNDAGKAENFENEMPDLNRLEEWKWNC